MITREDSTGSLGTGKVFWSSPLVRGAPRFPGDLDACPRVCLYDRYARNAGFTLAEKTSLFSLGCLVITRSLPRDAYSTSPMISRLKISVFQVRFRLPDPGPADGGKGGPGVGTGVAARARVGQAVLCRPKCVTNGFSAPQVVIERCHETPGQNVPDG